MTEVFKAKYLPEIPNSGYGEYKYPSGNIYKGTWKNGKQDGLGEYRWADGSVNTGDVYFGILQLIIIIIGSWKEGKYDGEGEYRGADGSFYKGLL